MSNYLITTESGDKVLLHYGVKGMKWGNRKKSDGFSASGGGDINDNESDEAGDQTDEKKEMVDILKNKAYRPWKEKEHEEQEEERKKNMKFKHRLYDGEPLTAKILRYLRKDRWVY